MSAGFDQDADELLTPELIDWADLIFIMERKHKAESAARFRGNLRDKQVAVSTFRIDTHSWIRETGLLEANVRPHWAR